MIIRHVFAAIVAQFLAEAFDGSVFFGKSSKRASLSFFNNLLLVAETFVTGVVQVWRELIFAFE